MPEIGKRNHLVILKEVEFGLYLDGGEWGEILLPRKYRPENCSPGDILDVFLYRDSEDRLIATTQVPLAMAGEFACLKVVSVTSLGAFLDWGLEKDLFVPFREQKQKMKKDHSYVVYIYLDTKSDRIAASSRLDKFLNREPANYETGQEVTLLIVNETGVGYSAIVNGSHWGLLFKEDVFQSLEIGQQLQGYIKKVRPDKKIDLSLHKAGYDKIENISGKILQIIKQQGGSVDVTDKSPPENISEMFGVSKKTFKIAIGALYRKRLIKIDKDHISLISPKV